MQDRCLLIIDSVVKECKKIVTDSQSGACRRVRGAEGCTMGAIRDDVSWFDVDWDMVAVHGIDDENGKVCAPITIPITHHVKLT